MAEEIEIQMMRITTLELPLSKTYESKSISLPSFSLSLAEVTKNKIEREVGSKVFSSFYDKEEFDYLKISFKIGGDDPRIKAIDVYTQFSGIQTILIKHAPKDIWPAGIAFYSGFPEWDDSQDRTLSVGESVSTKISSPTSYIRATGLRAKSWPLEGSIDSEIAVGMFPGGGDTPNRQGKTYSRGSLSCDLGGTLEYDPENMPSGCALESHNPICSYEYEWIDKRPIPFSCYQVWGYISDPTGIITSDPILLCWALYQTEWLKIGIISGKTSRSDGFYDYIVSYIAGSVSDGSISWSSVEVLNTFSNYEVGRWVLLLKQNDESHIIVSSSSLYWENAVEFFRANPRI